MTRRKKGHVRPSQQGATSGANPRPALEPFVGQALLDALEQSSVRDESSAQPKVPARISKAGQRGVGSRVGRAHAEKCLVSSTPSCRLPSRQEQQFACKDLGRSLSRKERVRMKQQEASLVRQRRTTNPRPRLPHRGLRNELASCAEEAISHGEDYPAIRLHDDQYHGLGHGLWPLPPALSPNAPYFPTILPVFSNLYNIRQSSWSTAGAILSAHQHNPYMQSYTPINRYHTSVPLSSAGESYERVASRITAQPAQCPESPRIVKKPTMPSKRPKTSETYLSQAAQLPQRLPKAQPLLVISDLNGTLLLRSNKGSSYKPRPGLQKFIDYLFSNHKVMIWTSARPHNCTNMCRTLFNATERSKLVAVWARDTLLLTKEQYDGHTQEYKRLTSVWADEHIQAAHPSFKTGGRWSQANTLLIDDSVVKAAAQPFNLINIPELTRDMMNLEEQQSVLDQVMRYLDEARWWNDVSAFVQKTPFTVGEQWDVQRQ